MAQAYNCGPGFVYVGSGTATGAASNFTNGKIRFLGTCEAFPQVRIRRAYEPLFNDITGAIPLDYSWLGEEAFIGLDLTRYNEAVYAMLASTPNSRTGVHAGLSLRGANLFGDMGRMTLTEHEYVQLYIQFPYAVKAAFAGGNMPAGYRFVACQFEGPDEFAQGGTRPRKVHVLFHACRMYYPATRSSLLYDHVMAGLPAPD